MKKGSADTFIISIVLGICCSMLLLVYYIAFRVDKISNQLDNAYEYLNEYDQQKHSEYLEDQSKKLKYAKTYYIPKDAEYPEWIENRQEPECKEKETVIDNVFITHYCPCEKCCGKWASGYTADGSKAISGITIAAGKSLMNFGDKVEINGHVYTCQDRGVNGKHIDIFCDSHEEALKKGSYYTTIKIYK